MRARLYIVFAFACFVVAALAAFALQPHVTRQSTTVPQASDPPPTETPAIPTPDLLAEPRAALAMLPQADALYLANDWTGLTDMAPLNSHYDLHKQGANFVGTGDFSVAGYTNEQTATLSISIPADVVGSFLEMLSQCTLEYHYYEPEIGHTDDYPSISFQISANNENVTIFTGSQGIDHVPWAIRYRGNTYVINSAQPMNAFRLLSPYLKEDTIDKLLDKAYASIGMPDSGKQGPQP